MFTSFLTKIARFATGASSTACVFWYIDEPKCPKSFIK